MLSSNDNHQYHVRYANPTDLEFAANLERENMFEYFQRFELEYPETSYPVNWRKTQNFILQLGETSIGVLRLAALDNMLIIHDIQIASGFRCHGAGTVLLDGAHRMAKGEGFKFCLLSVFVGNPAIRFYVRNGYQYSQPILIPGQNEWHMFRRV